MSGRQITSAVGATVVVVGGAFMIHVLASGAAGPSKGTGDPAAVTIVGSMMKAMGGEETFRKTGAIRFTWIAVAKDSVRAERSHWWDRLTGDYRIQGNAPDGRPYVILFNTQTKDGRVYVAGRELEGTERSDYLQRAYKMFINDMYWFLMPYKLFDPGVHLAMAGEAVVDGKPVDRVNVTFDHVGLTPGDTYWAYIDRGSHLMIRWGYILQDARDKPEQLFDWTNWKRYGGLMLSSDRVKVDDPGTGIRIRNIEVTDKFPPEVFTSPETIPL